jgi:hypothetical protein
MECILVALTSAGNICMPEAGCIYITYVCDLVVEN